MAKIVDGVVVKTGGRQKGTPNKQTVNARDLAFELNIDPLEVLLRFAAGDWKGLGYEAEVYHMETPSGEIKMGFTISPAMRINAAGQAVKYIYPSKIDTTISPAGDSDTEKLKAIDELKKVFGG